MSEMRRRLSGIDHAMANTRTWAESLMNACGLTEEHVMRRHLNEKLVDQEAALAKAVTAQGELDKRTHQRRERGYHE